MKNIEQYLRKIGVSARPKITYSTLQRIKHKINIAYFVIFWEVGRSEIFSVFSFLSKPIIIYVILFDNFRSSQ